MVGGGHGGSGAAAAGRTVRRLVRVMFVEVDIFNSHARFGYGKLGCDLVQIGMPAVAVTSMFAFPRMVRTSVEFNSAGGRHFR